MQKSIGLAVLTLAISAPALAAKPDGWITTKTKLALWTTAGIDSTDISVDTINGVVTLYGKVDDADEKAKAEREARKIDGVVKVRNLLQVVPVGREKVVGKSDKEIKEGVEQALKKESLMSPETSISVKSVDAGVVLLAGTAGTMNDELRAIRCAAAVKGVQRVASEITTKEGVAETDYDMRSKEGATPGRRMNDGWLTSEVKLRLLADADVPALDVNVDTRDRVVSLFGSVPTDRAKKDAETDAKKVDGVERVINELEVAPSARHEVVKTKDDVIEKNVKRSLARHEGLAKVDVDVKGGVVRLTGTVPTHFEKLEAATVTRGARGVRSVTEELEVKKND
jgi:hyperosmotically inducible protein